MDFYAKDGVIIRVAEDSDKKGKKKGDGIGAAIGLLQELRNFIEKVDACVEAQDIAENKSAIAKHAATLSEMYQALLKIAEGGIRSIGDKTAGEVATGQTGPQTPDTTPTNAKPVLPAAPTVGV